MHSAAGGGNRFGGRDFRKDTGHGYAGWEACQSFVPFTHFAMHAVLHINSACDRQSKDCLRQALCARTHA